MPDFLETYEASCLVDESFDTIPDELLFLLEDHMQITAKHLEENPE